MISLKSWVLKNIKILTKVKVKTNIYFEKLKFKNYKDD